MEQNELIPYLFRNEHSKIIAVLCKKFGLKNIQVAEDIASETFLLAAETWGMKGIPPNPKGWLYTVAKNQTKDYLKRISLFSEKISPALERGTEIHTEIEIDLSENNITDSKLKMVFAICHTNLPPEAQISLALRILCGFGIEEIADAFLTTKSNINKKIFRAKEKLRNENLCLEMPGEMEIKVRLENVLSTIYLLFNEGYYSRSKNKVLQKNLCTEAIHLNYLLLQNKPTNLPNTNALQALMCFHASRFESRIGQSGEIILYEDQDPKKWDHELIEKGNIYLNRSASGNKVSKYHLEAAIAYWHTQPNDSEGKWDNILQLYNRLLLTAYSPVVALNRTYALAKVYGEKKALEEAKKINLGQSHLYHSLLAKLYEKEKPELSIEHLNIACNLAKNKSEKDIIHKKLKRLNQFYKPNVDLPNL